MLKRSHDPQLLICYLILDIRLDPTGIKMKEEDKLCFLVGWEDKNAGLLRNFQLYFYPQEKSVEMFDLKTKKTFLKKTQNENLKQGS